MRINTFLNKSINFLLVLIFFISSISSVSAKKTVIHHPKIVKTKSKPGKWILSRNKVDGLVIGTSIKEIYWNYAPKRIQKVLTYDGNGGYVQYEILSENLKEVLFTVVPECREGDSICIIKKIIVQSNQFSTPNHLKVGMSYKDINKSKQRLDFLGWFEGNLVLRTLDDQINYVLKTDKIPKNWYATMEPDSLPKNTAIINLIISGKDMEGFTFAQFDSIQLNKIHESFHPKIQKGSIAKNDTALHYYKVSPGETIFSIARKLKCNQSELLAINTQFIKTVLKAGQRIKIPIRESADAFHSLEIDPNHIKGPVSSIFIKTKGYAFGSSSDRISLVDSSKAKSFPVSGQDSVIRTN